MMAKSWSHALVCASLAGALAGCSTVPATQRPANPLPASLLANTNVGHDEPVPQFEPPSRSGNPDTYVVFGRRYRVKETSEGYREEGTASWYGWEFHGRKTSSGPLFNMFELTAAHKSLPLPTYARVTNLENGHSIVVKVNDRGPFIGGRVIDLSYAAADRLGMLEQGTARVEVAALAPYQYLPELATRRAEQRESLVRRETRPEPQPENVATIEFAREAPARPAAPVKASTRLAATTVEPSKPKLAAKTVDKPSLVKESGRNPKVVKARLASAAPTPKGKGTALERRTPALANDKRDKDNQLYLVATVTERSGARQVQNRLTSQLQRSVQIESGAGRRYEVRVPLRNPGEARQVAVRLASLGVSRSRIVAD